MQKPLDYFKHHTYPGRNNASPRVRTKLSSTDVLFTVHSTAARGLRNLGLDFLSLGKYHSRVCLVSLNDSCLSFTGLGFPLYIRHHSVLWRNDKMLQTSSTEHCQNFQHKWTPAYAATCVMRMTVFYKRLGLPGDFEPPSPFFLTGFCHSVF